MARQQLGTTPSAPADAVRLDTTARASASTTTASLADQATDSVTTISLKKAFTLLSLTVDRACRVRLYSTAAARTADASRAIGVDPAASAGVILDYYANTGAGTYPLSTLVFGANLDVSPSATSYLSVTNRSGSTSTVTVGLSYVPMEF